MVPVQNQFVWHRSKTSGYPDPHCLCCGWSSAAADQLTPFETSHALRSLRSLGAHYSNPLRFARGVLSEKKIFR
jgi:hypothetical protein